MSEVQHCRQVRHLKEREFFIDNLLVRIDFIIEIIWWTSLAPWEFEFPFPGSLISNFLVPPILKPQPSTLNPEPNTLNPTPKPLQGYLAHKKLQPPLGPLYAPRHSPTVGF